MYGIPGNANRGFKVADDTPGPVFDPTEGNRNVSEAGVAAAREFLSERFPGLAGAPLVGSEICQYETTPDANFIIDRHPAAPNVWIAGGGSGHGFKMGPVVGEMVAALVLEQAAPDPLFGLHRLATPPSAGWQPKWS
jgi:glycine/D-amino acid oxidase-like deaminating enzyme